MALLSIIRYPDARLHKKAKPVAVVDDRIRKLVRDMADTMYEAPGVGLAATQVDVHERVIVIDVSEEGRDLMVLINVMSFTNYTYRLTQIPIDFPLAKDI